MTAPTLCLIEVEIRASDESNLPQANIDLHKRRQIARALRAYRRMLGLMSAPYRYDVVTVLLPKETEAGSHVELLRSLWTDEKLRQRQSYDPAGISLGARTSCPHSVQSTLTPVLQCRVRAKTRFALRAQADRVSAIHKETK